MDDQAKLNKTTSAPPQASAQVPSPDSSQEDLPGSKHQSAASTTLPSPRHAFPPIMNAYGQWTKLKSFNLCGATEKDRLYQVSLHTGYSASAPLGTRPGVLLHNGMSSKDPVLAAAGYDSQASFYSFNNQSVVLMPPLPGAAARAGDFVTEQMPAVIRGGLLVFPFSVELDSGGKIQHEKFEWRKFKSGVDGSAKEGGFRLVRLPSSGSTRLGGEPDTVASSSPAGGDDSEVVACLAWCKLFPTFKHAFTLQLLGRGQSGELGERWSLMVVITALRLWALRANHKTSKSAIAGGQKTAGS
ncbi:hypothetical protein C8A01DRAFT_19413 [Parachaetomium inaequale]|uniref:Uncharacterized protein n=1 Tax=Parachaetomium inaequale TaxID=2588326 RepID=A0AAN6SN09_9PEZI|nr:hypothetical protein C8A01DRAFT_19413 [Parachaetomium inaequale]